MRTCFVRKEREAMCLFHDGKGLKERGASSSKRASLWTLMQNFEIHPQANINRQMFGRKIKVNFPLYNTMKTCKGVVVIFHHFYLDSACSGQLHALAVLPLRKGFTVPIR
jgi:hypothetical protein